MKLTQFTRGSATYKCRCCGRTTRNTGGDEGQLKLCFQCYELAGYENQLCDDGELSARARAECAALLNELRAKGVENPEKLFDLGDL